MFGETQSPNSHKRNDTKIFPSPFSSRLKSIDYSVCRCVSAHMFAARDVQEQFLFKLDNRSKIGKSDHASLFSGKSTKSCPGPDLVPQKNLILHTSCQGAPATRWETRVRSRFVGSSAGLPRVSGCRRGDRTCVNTTENRHVGQSFQMSFAGFVKHHGSG